MAMSAEHRSKFAALHRQWWRLHMSYKFSSGTKNPKQTKNFTQISSEAVWFLDRDYLILKKIIFVHFLIFKITFKRGNQNNSSSRFEYFDLIAIFL